MRLLPKSESLRKCVPFVYSLVINLMRIIQLGLVYLALNVES